MRKWEILEDDNDNIEFERTADRVIANLYSYKSQVYTKLGQKLQRIEQLSAEIDALKKETKTEVKENIVDLFLAEDAVRTRVVNTVSFTFTLSKDPKATESYKYAQILAELEKKLTPELITVLESLKEQFKTVTQKEPALRHNPIESVNEGIMDKLKTHYAKFKNLIFSWASNYDRKLNNLKRMTGDH